MEEEIIVTYSGNEEQFNITKELEDRYKIDKNSLNPAQLRLLLDFKNMALENLLTRYKQLEEENKNMAEEYLVNNPGMAKYLNDNYILKSKVKEKIEELDIQISECEYADDDIEERKQDIEKEKRLLLRDKKTLEELLGKE